MHKLLMAAAGLEAGLGAVLLLDPGIVSRLILGEDLSGSGIVLGRVAGFGFLAFGIACWPMRASDISKRQLQALLTYNVLLPIYLIWLGIHGTMVGILLWPVVATHAVLAILLGSAYLRQRT
jgi:hypothetical protein